MDSDLCQYLASPRTIISVPNVMGILMNKMMEKERHNFKVRLAWLFLILGKVI